MKIRKVSVKPAYFAWFAIFFVNMNMLLKRKTNNGKRKKKYIFVLFLHGQV